MQRIGTIISIRIWGWEIRKIPRHTVSTDGTEDHIFHMIMMVMADDNDFDDYDDDDHYEDDDNDDNVTTDKGRKGLSRRASSSSQASRSQPTLSPLSFGNKMWSSSSFYVRVSLSSLSL